MDAFDSLITNRVFSMKNAARLFAVVVAITATGHSLAEEAATVESRLSATTRYLASDALGGRGIGTDEIDAAAQYLRDEFAAMGLNVEAAGGDAFQEFDVTLASKLGKDNSARIVGTNGTTVWKIDTDYTPLALGGGGFIDAPLAFVGYGITAPEADYDDYAGIDVEGKVVIVLRHEPDQANPHSLFDGTDPSRHAPFTAKLSNAVQHGAAGVTFATDLFEVRRIAEQFERRRDAGVEQLAKLHGEFAAIEEPTDEQIAEYRQRTTQMARRIAQWAESGGSQADELLDFEGAGTSDRTLPVLFASRGALDDLFKQLGKPSLEEYETKIDAELTPKSVVLDGVRLVADVDVVRETVSAKNVVAVLEGDGPRADETIVIGAHYDHVGRGGPGSGAADPRQREIHNGADDNASGTAVLLEVARRFAAMPTPPTRRIVFIAFTGEERGLLGSAHYANDPIFPLDKTIAMLNMDMVGRLDKNKLIVSGTDTATEFNAWIDAANERSGFALAKVPGGFGPSDHASFYAKKIPVLHFFTGLHDEYHKPSDDIELLNLAGMRRVAEYVYDVAQQVVKSPDALTYQEAEGPSMPGTKTGSRPYFGSIPDFGKQVEGYPISGVAPNSPAADGGLAGGDVIVGLNELKIASLDDFDNGLRKFKAGDKVKITVTRDGKQVELEVVLDPPK